MDRDARPCERHREWGRPVTQPCDNCGTPTENPTCDRCLGYQAWATDSGNPRPESGRNHERRIRETRQHLGELPELYAQLWMFSEPGSAPKDPDQRSGKSNPAHRSVVNLDVLDLTDERLKDDAEDMRTDYGIDSRAGARRQGVVNTLASWSRLVCSEMSDEDIESDLADEPTISSECGYLLKHLAWIAEHQWYDDEMHPDVKTIWSDVRRAIGVRDWITLKCRYCQNPVHPVDASFNPTSWEACAFGKCEACDRGLFRIGPELAALGKVQESVPLDVISKTLGIPLPTLYRWWKVGVFDAAPESPKRPSSRRPAVFDLATVRDRVALVRSA
jgi:hypothetical protein